MDSTIRSNIKIGQTVKVIQKQDQRTGKRRTDINKLRQSSQRH